MKGRDVYRIERLLRRGHSKDGVASHLSYRDLISENTPHLIDTVFKGILLEGNHIVSKLKGKSKSDILFLKNEHPPKSFRTNTLTEL